jgi:putative ABC transport system substrate-binding protein
MFNNNKFAKFFCFFCLFLFFSTLPTKAHAKYKIYMALWSGWEDAAQGFKDQLKNNKIDFELIVRDANRNLLKIPEFVQEVKEIKPDLLVTWGTMMTLGMTGPVNNQKQDKYITDIPTVFMVVSQPIGARIVNNYASSGRNLTGAVSLVSLEEQLEMARRYVPIKKIGILYNALEGNSKICVERLRALSKKYGFLLFEEKIPLDGEGKPVEDSVDYLVARLAENKPDVIYLGPDSFLNQYRDVLTLSALEKRIPVFSAGESAVVKSNALFAYVNRYYNIGKLAGQKAYDILEKGQKPTDIPITAPKKPIMVINMDVAKRLFMLPPLDLMEKSDIVNYK